jgi:murein DD-endopeptidase MepM/ murein hydrolase activator NlpD
MRTLLGILFAAAISTPVFAGGADVVGVKISGSGGSYNFSVTVKHDDTGWEHFANRWEVVGEDGTVYGTRVLAHPHVNEQPFTRSGSIKIPAGVTTVIVRANDLVHGLGGKEMKVSLPE